MASQKVMDVFQKLNMRLEDLEFIIDNLVTLPGSMRANISRIAVEGRAITNILQLVKNKVQNFDEWYLPKQEEMRKDELLRYFYELRTETLKKGEDRIKGVKISPQQNAKLTMNEKGAVAEKILPNGEIRTTFIPRPDNAVSTFIAAPGGGIGWNVIDKDGREKKQYVQIPEDVLEISVILDNPPRTHLGMSVTEMNTAELCRLYFNYLRQLYNEAENRFNQT